MSHLNSRTKSAGVGSMILMIGLAVTAASCRRDASPPLDRDPTGYSASQESADPGVSDNESTRPDESASGGPPSIDKLAVDPETSDVKAVSLTILDLCESLREPTGSVPSKDRHEAGL
jgi:hypothetical protein